MLKHKSKKRKWVCVNKSKVTEVKHKLYHSHSIRFTCPVFYQTLYIYTTLSDLHYITMSLVFTESLNTMQRHTPVRASIHHRAPGHYNNNKNQKLQPCDQKVVASIPKVDKSGQGYTPCCACLLNAAPLCVFTSVCQWIQFDAEKKVPSVYKHNIVLLSFKNKNKCENITYSDNKLFLSLDSFYQNCIELNTLKH